MTGATVEAQFESKDSLVLTESGENLLSGDGMELEANLLPVGR